MRNRVNDKVKEAKANYFSDKVEEHKSSPKSLWKQFKSLGYSNKNKEKSRIVLEIDNEKCFDPKKVAQHMCNFFLNIATILKNKLPPMPQLFDISTNIEAKIFRPPIKDIQGIKIHHIMSSYSWQPSKQVILTNNQILYPFIKYLK